MSGPCGPEVEKLSSQVDTLSQGIFFEILESYFALKDTLESSSTPESNSCREKLKDLGPKIELKWPAFEKNAESLALRSQFAFERGNDSEGKAYLDQALKVFPTHLKTNFYFSKILPKSSTPKEKHLRRVLVENPVGPREETMVLESIEALVTEFNLDPEESLTLLERALKIDPTKQSLWQRQAEMGFKSKNSQKIEESLARINPEYRFFFQAKAAEFKGQLDMAEEAFRSFLMQAKKPKREWDVEARLWLGKHYLQKNLFAVARPLLEESLDLFPDEPQFYILHGECFLKGSLDPLDPKKDLERALFKNPNSIPILIALAAEILKGGEPWVANSKAPDAIARTQAEGILRRLEDLEKQPKKSIQSEIWRISLLWHKGQFTQAHNRWNLLNDSIGSSSYPLPEKDRVQFLILGARILKSRGRFSEAEVLLTEGLKKTKEPEEQKLIRSFL